MIISRVSAWAGGGGLVTKTKSLLTNRVSKSHLVLSDSCDPMDCSLPGSSVHGILQARITGVGCHFLLQGIFPTQE